MFSFSPPKWKTKTYYWQTLPKYLNLDMNYNLTPKLKKILIPIIQRFPKAHDTFIKHIMYQTIEKPRHKIYLWSEHTKGIEKPRHKIYLWSKHTNGWAYKFITQNIYPNFKIKSSKSELTIIVYYSFQRHMPHL